METRANHVLIGAFTLAGLVLLLVVGLWSARYALDDDSREYEVVFSQPVTGLSVGSAVQYNGINMGSVRELYLAPEDPGQVIVRIRVQADAPVREDTMARLAVSGLTGVSVIQLRGGRPESPPLEPGPDQEYPRIIAEESALQRLIETSEDIASAASEVMLRLLDFLSEENAERVSTTLDNIDAFTLALTAESEQFGEIVSNINRGSARFPEVVDESRELIDRLQRVLEDVDTHLVATLPEIGDEMQQTIRRLARVADRIDRILAANEAAAADFGVEVLAPMGPAVQEFRQLVRELSYMTSRFERHPTRFMFGGEQPEEYKPR